MSGGRRSGGDPLGLFQDSTVAPSSRSKLTPPKDAEPRRRAVDCLAGGEGQGAGHVFEQVANPETAAALKALGELPDPD